MASSALNALIEQRQLAQSFAVDSAGTCAAHQGAQPDPRAMAVTQARGYGQIVRHRARRVVEHDFGHFDLLLAMDRDNLSHLQRHCPAPHRHKLHLFLEYAAVTQASEVPDPYYGNTAGFERVMALCEAGAAGVLQRLLAPPVGHT